QYLSKKRKPIEKLPRVKLSCRPPPPLAVAGTSLNLAIFLVCSRILLLLPLKLYAIPLFAAEQFEQPSFSRSDEPLVDLWA
ncbi:unnamed protein product, partial [Brassica oleracea var. botrytis]